MPEKRKPGGFEMEFRLDAAPGPLTDLVADKTRKDIREEEKNKDQATGRDAGNLQNSKQNAYGGRSHNTKVFYFIRKLPHLYALKAWEYDLLSFDLHPLQISSFLLLHVELLLKAIPIFQFRLNWLYVNVTT
jgi:hypothetical protein